MTIDTSKEAVERLLDGVTPGPWMREAQSIYHSGGYGLVAHLKAHEWRRDWPTLERDGDFIAAARKLVPALAAERDAQTARADAAEAEVARLTAALAASRAAHDCHQPDLVTAAQVRIKPLVWDGFVAGSYHIEIEDGGIARLWRYSAEMVENEEPEYIRGGYLTLVSLYDLKAEAQADHEARILSALDLTPAPAVEPVAWFCEEKRIMDDGWTARLVFDHPEAGPRYRNVTPLYANPLAPTAQDAALVPEIAALTDDQVTSVCLSYRHDFGLLDASDRAALMWDAREWLRAWQKEIPALRAIGGDA